MKIGIIGAGVMGSLLAQRLASGDNEVMVSDVDEKKLDVLGKEKGISTTKKNTDAVAFGDVVFMAVKPQQFDLIVNDLKGMKGTDKTLVSVLAGTPLSKYIAALGEIRLARIMPNLPISLGKGVVGLALGKELNKSDGDILGQLLAPLGTVLTVQEKLIDGITALAGSGPAYIFLMIEAMADAGVRLGFTFAQSLEMTLAVFEGSAAFARESAKHPAELKAMVSSPAGTTVEGLKALENGGVRAAINDAVMAALKRAKELSG